MKEYNNDSLFVKVPLSYINEYKSDINNSYQIGFVDGGNSDVSYIYAQEQSFGDGALSNKTLLQDNICLAGGPLADMVKAQFPLGDKEDLYGGNPYISKGTDLFSILVKLLTKEIWNKPNVVKATFTLTNNAPTITNYTNKWVGEEVNITITRTNPSVSSTNPYISNLTYGYATGTAYTQKYTSNRVEGTSSATMIQNEEGIVYYKVNTGSWNYVDAGSHVITHKVISGTNTITSYQNYAKMSYSSSAILSLMPLSNVKHTYLEAFEGSTANNTNTYSIAEVSVAEYTQNTKSSNASETFTGVYKLNYGVGNNFSDISNITYAIGSTAGKKVFELSFTGSSTGCKCVAFPKSFADPKVQIMTTGWTDNNDYTIYTNTSYKNCGVEYKFLIYNSPNSNNQQLKLTFTNAF